MAEKELILKRVSDDLRGSNESVRTHRLYYCRKFLDYADGTELSQWNRDLVDGFVSQLQKEGYAKGTIRTVFGIIKRVYDAAKDVSEDEKNRAVSEIDPNDPSATARLIQIVSKPSPRWDVGKRNPRVETGDVVKPSLTFDEMEKMVSAAKNGLLEPAESFFLAITSVYGLRREELCRLRKEHFDFDKKTFWVDTAKGGEKRNQLLCDEVIPYVENHSFERWSLFKVSWLFWKICDKSGVERREGMGWHSARRLLDTLLIDQFGEREAHLFLRWKFSTMPLWYYSADLLELDRELMSNHPILNLWRSDIMESSNGV